LGQWVHRFGIDSLPVTHATAPEASAESFDQLQSAAVFSIVESSKYQLETSEVEDSLDVAAQELVPPMEQNLDTPAVVAIKQISADLADTEADLTAVTEDLIVQELLDEESGNASEAAADDRNVVVPMTPPPISTPRSLRRWLPRADQSFPQAS
jgi:hypothetical protein